MDEIAITRVFDAPRERVWKAWTEPEQLARWWGERGWSTPLETITMDVRPGGVLRLTSISDADGTEVPLDAVYRIVLEPMRLAFGPAAGSDGPGAVAVVGFADLGEGRTEMVFRTTIQAADEIGRATEGGLASAFDRLAEHLG